MKKLLLIVLCLSANCFAYNKSNLKIDNLDLDIYKEISSSANRLFPDDFEKQGDYMEKQQKGYCKVLNFYREMIIIENRIAQGVDE